MKLPRAYLLILFCLSCELYAWENRITHPALTNEAVGASSIDNYLKTYLGSNNGVTTELYWDFSFFLHVKEPIEAGETDPSKTTRKYGVLEFSRR